jgi:hypothetical protein
VNWLPWYPFSVRVQLSGLPPEALDTLIELMIRLCTDPYDRMTSMPLPGPGRKRLAELGDRGWLEFTPDEDAGLLRVYRLVWTG